MLTTTLEDPYGRVIDSLRILVTLKCNYKCIFCHSEGVLGHAEEVLNAEDYGFIAEVASSVGIKFYKISGGEPLLRDDIADIVRSIKPHARELSLVTNGSLLLERAKLLADSGLDRLNVSLHAFSKALYEYVTGSYVPVSRIVEGVKEALKYGIKVKINFLAMKSNLGEFFKVLEFAEENGLDVNLIELIPLGVPLDTYRREHVFLGSIVDFLERNSVAKYYRELHNRPVYVLASGIKVEVVIGYGNYLFCSRCSRLRLTPDGYLKPCLYVEDLKVCVLKSVKARDREGLMNALHEVVKLRMPYFKLEVGGGVGQDDRRNQ
ncbi:MAG: GTP 3',8-cyclase MoaA [Desulfurococcaceae archaeon]